VAIAEADAYCRPYFDALFFGRRRFVPMRLISAPFALPFIEELILAYLRVGPAAAATSSRLAIAGAFAMAAAASAWRIFWRFS